MANANDGNGAAGNATATLFTHISFPVLCSTDPKEVARFLNERERYVVEVETEQAGILSLHVSPFIASVDRAMLRSALMLGKLNEIAPGGADIMGLTNDHIESYVKNLVRQENGAQINRRAIQRSLDGWTMRSSIAGPEARVFTVCSVFVERLPAIGYGDFINSNTKRSERMLTNKLEPAALKRKVRKSIEYDELLEKNPQHFVALVSKLAADCQRLNTEATTRFSPGGIGKTNPLSTGRKKRKYLAVA